MKVSKDKTFDLNHHNMGLFDILNFIIIINFDKILAAWRQLPQPLPQNLHLIIIIIIFNTYIALFL